MTRGETLTLADVARWRLHNLRLEGPPEADPESVVRHLLAVQAENPSQVAWAVGTRCGATSEQDVFTPLDAGRFVRTHALRFTWHYVTTEDLSWLMALTRPRVLPTYDRQLRDQGIEGARRTRLLDLVASEVADRPLTRTELGAALSARGEDLTGFVLMILAAVAEVEELVCSGPRAAGEHTYTSFDQVVVGSRDLSGEAALAELAVRYVGGHGPVTDRDLAYWSSQSLTVARRALAAAGEALVSVEVEGRRFWHLADAAPPGVAADRGHLLQILDEYYRGYQDSRLLLDLAGHHDRAPERFLGMAVVGSQIVGDMKRTVTDRTVRFDVRPWRRLAAGERDLLAGAARRYGDFLGREPRLELAV